MSSITAGPRRSRRRLALWLAFGAIGLSMGAVWATGFATFSAGANGTTTVSPIVVPGSPTDVANPLASVVTAGSTWNVNWTGDWGSTGATEFFQVDLSSLPSAQTYNLAMLLTNGAAMSAGTNLWQTLQLNVELTQPAGSSCAASDFTTSSTTEVSRIFVFDSDDAGVYWNSADTDVQSTLSGITGGQIYCIGINAAAPPYDGTSTFLRDDGAVPSVYPDFVTTVNRAS